MKGVFVTITGFVQGVGYRQFVKQQARKLGLVGWVQNMPDGSVESKAFGEHEKLQELVEHCKKGPFLSEVKDVRVEWIEEDNVPSDFATLHG